MSETRRRLPHIYPEGKWLFVTWHLNGSLPQGRYPPPGLRAGGAFVWMDRYLDTTREGPMYLRREDIARIVVNSLQRGFELSHYELRAWVIMANHVHVLCRRRRRRRRHRLRRRNVGRAARGGDRLIARLVSPGPGLQLGLEVVCLLIAPGLPAERWIGQVPFGVLPLDITVQLARLAPVRPPEVLMETRVAELNPEGFRVPGLDFHQPHAAVVFRTGVLHADIDAGSLGWFPMVS